MSLLHTFCVSVLIFVSVSVLYFLPSKKGLPTPPGPQGSLISGVKNLLPKTLPWETYASWAEQYHESIISFRVYNRRIVVLNDITSVRDLLEKRANIYSDRPKSWMYHEICDRKKSVFNISSTDPRHRQYRRLLHTGLGPLAVRDYWPLIQSEAETLLEGFAKSPEKYETHIRRNAAAVIMKMAFGYTVTADDPLIQDAEEASKISGWAMAPGRWLVDYIPIIRFIPSWFPGAGWKKQGEEWRVRLDKLSGVPHAWVKQQMASGGYTESFTSRHLQYPQPGIIDAERDDIVKWCAGGLYAGAADTTVSAIISFVLLMALHPEVQSRIQAELDTTVGRDMVPHASDLEHFPYLTAVLKEVLRYAPVANLALPHKVIEEDEYRGYRIPKEATIMANIWQVMAITHDPSVYPKPFTFSPDRFLSPERSSRSTSPDVQPDPRSFSFGFGRRTCPGLHFAETSMMLTLACILSRFDISLPPDTAPPSIQFTMGITRFVTDHTS
ncbi:cytochrome P450 [Collybia nuda]|uniref:Cytochrome P450 n=1 Tax=Collybia nuda TaxID=64659 RepID=A0A9P5XRU5_9AGAR|nr:cytochrome P450 [Collybia nuda]